MNRVSHMKAHPRKWEKNYQEIEEHDGLENNQKPNSTKIETLKFGSNGKKGLKLSRLARDRI